MRIRSTILDLITCLSIANLVMLKNWLVLFPFDSKKSFWLAHSQFNCYLAALINTLLIGVGLWFVLFIVGRWKGTTTLLWPLICGVTLGFALNGIRSQYAFGMHNIYRVHGNWSGLVAVVAVIFLLAGTAFCMIRYRHQAGRLYPKVALFFAPFMIVTFGSSIYALQQVEPESAFLPHVRKNISVSANTPEIPVVWIIFDELDYGITFERQPKELLHPELDSLKRTSLFATHAYSPFDATSLSIPALLTGSSLKNTIPHNSANMTLMRTDGTIRELRTESTIFSDMRDRSIRTALLGWFFPYARLFNVDFNVSYPQFLIPISESLTKTVILQLRNLVESEYFSPFGDSLTANNHITNTTSLHREAIIQLQKNRYGFIFLHYPVPHNPNIFDSHSHSYGTNRNIREGYLDNVALADVLLGEIRATMQEIDTWDKALVILSSDHHWRFNTYDGVIDKRHVPFLVKLPHQKSGIMFSDRFQTVNTRHRAIGYMSGFSHNLFVAQIFNTDF